MTGNQRSKQTNDDNSGQKLFTLRAETPGRTKVPTDNIRCWLRHPITQFTVTLWQKTHTCRTRLFFGVIQQPEWLLCSDEALLLLCFSTVHCLWTRGPFCCTDRLWPAGGDTAPPVAASLSFQQLHKFLCSTLCNKTTFIKTKRNW